MLSYSRRMKIEYEIKTVRLMIELYCRRKEGHARLCEECAGLAAYAEQRLRRCPFGDAKSSCKSCTIHCYRPEMREKIRRVMRYAGPRMIFYHPVAAIRHLTGR